MAAVDDVLNKDKEAFIRQIEANNPENRVGAQYTSTVDFTKHVKNLSVRYVSTILPREDNLDDWIVLPLFQHGQDIPIDNDGRTAILLAHAPSLERLLEMWRDRLHSERHDHKERRRRHKIERREIRHQKRAEKRKLKETQELEGQFKHYKLDDIVRSQSKAPVVSTVDSGRKDYQMKHKSAEQSNMSLKYSNQSTKTSNIDIISDTCTTVIPAGNKTVKSDSTIVHKKDANQPRLDNRIEDIEKSHIKKNEKSLLTPQNTRDAQHGIPNISPSQNIELIENKVLAHAPITSSTDIDDNDGILAMEQQLAGIQASDNSEDSKMREDENCELYLESDHAASNLERELNGKPMECKKFKESLLRVEPLLAVVEILPDLIQEHRPTKAELKKNSASNKVKNSLLQRMAEGREVDVDATNSVVCESDYKNTFCYLCRIDFPNTKGLYLHNVKVHSEGEVQCDICYKPLKNRITLMKHKKLHLGAEDMQCVCTDCGRPFKDKRALTAHVTYTRHMIDPCAGARS